MIDWLWVRVVCEAAGTLRPGSIVSITADGEIEWQTPKWLQARGSHDCTLAARARPGELELSGSPAKFLQGHNAFGSDDLRALAREIIARACTSLGVALTPDEQSRVDQGEVQLLRVDVNYSFVTGGRANALAWIRAAEQHGYLQHRGRGMLKGTTVVWGAKSRHWQIKAYCKGQEIEATNHHLPAELAHRDLVTEWCNDKLRIELQMNARYLRERGLRHVRDWESDTPAVLHSEHLSKLALNGEVKIEQKHLVELPRAVQQVYQLWHSGADVRALMSARSFYRHRRTLLAHGIDIAVAVPGARSNVVPLIRYVEAVPASTPSWASGTAILWEPLRQAG
ncbi:MAG TPA: phage/plasmid replication protein, II/X family [Ktedonobacterales bacterium]|nr:phage/plasmid replication protein, II/X family [Ktedonobacterales bacterium]